MEPSQGTPLQPSGLEPATSSSQAPKIPIEPERMQAIKEAFETYKNWAPDASSLSSWAVYRIKVANQLDDSDAKALCDRTGAPAMDSLDIINWLFANGVIHENTDELNTLIENNFREKKPDEAIQPHLADVKTKAQRREVITAAYQEYLDVDPANAENKIAAYNTFIDKVNEQVTAQEVKSIVLMYGALATISDFKRFTHWLEGQPDLSNGLSMLDGRDPSTVKRMMGTIFPSTKM